MVILIIRVEFAKQRYSHDVSLHYSNNAMLIRVHTVLKDKDLNIQLIIRALPPTALNPPVGYN